MKEQELIDIKQVCKLIKTKAKGKLRKKDKIAFAYQYWNITDQDIVDLYNYLAQNQPRNSVNFARTLGDFMDNQGITPYRKFYSSFFEENINTIMKATTPIKTNGNWLSLYNLEAEFNAKSTHSNPIIYSYLTPNDNIIKIDKGRAKQILGILMENNIPTAKCIVTGSFPYYVKDEMSSYIKRLKK